MSEDRIRAAAFYKQALASAALIALTASAGGAFAQTAPAAAVAATPAAEPALTREQVDALLATPDKVAFVDVRRADEIAASGSVPVFLNIQVSELDRFLPYIPRDRQIVTISNHAGRAGRAATLLRSKGFTVAGAFGAEDYAAKGGTLYGKKFVTPAIAGVVAADTRVQVVREGFEGTEGPIALADGALLFTENRADRIVKIDTGGAVSTYLEKTGGANALALNAKGELLAVQTAPSGIALLQPKAKVLAATYEGKPLNRPNDFAVARSGDIYFSDPGANAAAGAAPVKAGFYWLDRRGKLQLVADDIRRPNGVALSADEKTVYVANTAGENLLAYAVKPDGSLGDRRDFAKLAGFKAEGGTASSGADGIAVDEAGRVYVATNAGIEIFSPEGQALGTIALPKKPQNLAFAGKDRSQLYAVGRGSVFRIATQTHGVNRPGK